MSSAKPEAASSPDLGPLVSENKRDEGDKFFLPLALGVCFYGYHL